MTPDEIAEGVLIDISRVQRETLERWSMVCALAGEDREAERLRALAASRGEDMEARHAA